MPAYRAYSFDIDIAQVPLNNVKYIAWLSNEPVGERGGS